MARTHPGQTPALLGLVLGCADRHFACLPDPGRRDRQWTGSILGRPELAVRRIVPVVWLRMHRFQHDAHPVAARPDPAAEQACCSGRSKHLHRLPDPPAGAGSDQLRAEFHRPPRNDQVRPGFGCSPWSCATCWQLACAACRGPGPFYEMDQPIPLPPSLSGFKGGHPPSPCPTCPFGHPKRVPPRKSGGRGVEFKPFLATKRRQKGQKKVSSQ